jgi:hypothetical protein
MYKERGRYVSQIRAKPFAIRVGSTKAEDEELKLSVINIRGKQDRKNERTKREKRKKQETHLNEHARLIVLISGEHLIFRSMSGTPPIVSIPRERGASSNKNKTARNVS